MKSLERLHGHVSETADRQHKWESWTKDAVQEDQDRRADERESVRQDYDDAIGPDPGGPSFGSLITDMDDWRRSIRLIPRTPRDFLVWFTLGCVLLATDVLFVMVVSAVTDTIPGWALSLPWTLGLSLLALTLLTALGIVLTMARGFIARAGWVMCGVSFVLWLPILVFLAIFLGVVLRLFGVAARMVLKVLDGRRHLQGAVTGLGILFYCLGNALQYLGTFWEGALVRSDAGEPHSVALCADDRPAGPMGHPVPHFCLTSEHCTPATY